MQVPGLGDPGDGDHRAGYLKTINTCLFCPFRTAL